MSNYQINPAPNWCWIKLEAFEGPLDLLLQLIENQEMDVTKVSLAKVADQFIEYVNQAAVLNPGEVADFLVVAAKLLLIKSKILLPGLNLVDEEEGDLERQLKIYREYYEASKIIEKMIGKKRFSFARAKPIRVFSPRFSPPKSLKLGELALIYREILAKLEPIVNLPQEVIKRTISIRDKIKRISELILEKISFSFKHLLGRNSNKTEIIVSFLAVLELVKQKTISVEQLGMFEEIEIKRINN